MAKVTWLGQAPDHIEQWGITFKKGEAVEVDDPSIVVRAEGDPGFKVEAKAKPVVKPTKVEEHKPVSLRNDEHSSKK